MSIKRLTHDERVTYLIGKAIRDTMNTAPGDPDMNRERGIVLRWIESALPVPEFEEIQIVTGWITDDDYEDLTMPHLPDGKDAPRDPDDEEMPF